MLSSYAVRVGTLRAELLVGTKEVHEWKAYMDQLELPRIVTAILRCSVTIDDVEK